MSLDETRLMRYLEDRFSAINKRFDVIEQRLDANIEALRNAMDGLYGRTDTLESESTAATSHFRRVDDTFKRHRLHP